MIPREGVCGWHDHEVGDLTEVTSFGTAANPEVWYYSNALNIPESWPLVEERILALSANVWSAYQVLRDHLNGILLAITRCSQDGTRVVIRPPGQRPHADAAPSAPLGPLLPQAGGGNAPS